MKLNTYAIFFSGKIIETATHRMIAIPIKSRKSITPPLINHKRVVIKKMLRINPVDQ